MKERHLDGTVLMRAAGGIFEPLSRPDLLITDADRASVLTSRRKDRDAALIGMPCLTHIYKANLNSALIQTPSQQPFHLGHPYCCPATPALVSSNSWFSLTNIGITPA